MKLLKSSILNKIQVAGEVNGALNEYELVIVLKTQVKEASPVYSIYGSHGQLENGQVKER